MWVTGQDVHARNDAIALADCTRCTSVAVAFQAVFLIGQSNVIAPVNTSQALNYHCVAVPHHARSPCSWSSR